MSDIKSPEARSRNMSKIRGKDTIPEVWLRKKIFNLGFRYRKNVKNLPGHPDLWLAKYHTTIFVHGCFWHRHTGCKYSYMPQSHVNFWSQKFEANVKRDIRVSHDLLNKGIRVLIVWECTVKKMMRSDDVCKEMLKRISEFLNSEQCMLEI